MIMASRDDSNAAALLLKIGNAPRDNMSLQRQQTKAATMAAVEHVLSAAIAKDTKYAQQIGSISRSYKASGVYLNCHFDVHVVMAVPQSYFDIVSSDHKLPSVNVQLSAKKSAPHGFADVLLGNALSAAKVKESLKAAIVKQIDLWNRSNGQQHGMMNLVEDRPANPLCISFADPRSATATITSITPVVLASQLGEWADLRQKIANNTSSWRHPTNAQSRQNLANDVTLIGRGDSWVLCNVILLKQLTAAFKDHRSFKAVCSLLSVHSLAQVLYSAMKQVNKKVWAPPSDALAYHIAAHTLMQSFLNEVGRTPSQAWTSQDQILPRFKSIMADFRSKLASAELKEYAQMGDMNHLHGYKSSSFLNPVLGSIVRRVEATQKDTMGIVQKVHDMK